MEASSELQILGRILISAVFAGLIGLEREFADKPAGLRTHMLVGSTSTLLVMLAIQMVASFDPESLINTDPIRIVQAIVVGISFLGAGTILKYQREGEKDVEGLTTSASILSVAAVGIAVALDDFILAGGVTALNLLINWGFNSIVQRAKRKNSIEEKSP
jgi:putative Mg2+ transporter-C (MgtC) family protein